MIKKKLISIGIICFNEELNITPVYLELNRVANLNKKYDFEFVFVDNGSIDNTKEEIGKLVLKDRRVSGVFLSRNFGPEASTQASLECCKGDAYICYEGDMQDPPDVILDFIKEWEKGFDVVLGLRNKTTDSFVMSKIRTNYYKILRAISNIEIPLNVGSFGLLDKKVMQAITDLPEKYRSFRGLRAWVGFKTTYVKYNRGKRVQGKSSYNLLKYLHDAERSFLGFSYLPLDILVYTGIILTFISFIFATIYLFLLIFGQTIIWPMVIFLLVCFFVSIQLLALGIIGKYIQVIVEETKRRPTYIIAKVLKK